MNAHYEIIESESNEDVLVIRDLGPWDVFHSVTNAVEGVVRELHATGQLFSGRRLLYYDSHGDLDEILHEKGEFIGFLSGYRKLT